MERFVIWLKCLVRLLFYSFMLVVGLAILLIGVLFWRLLADSEGKSTALYYSSDKKYVAVIQTFVRGGSVAASCVEELYIIPAGMPTETVSSKYKIALFDCATFSSRESSPQWAWVGGREFLVMFSPPFNNGRLADYYLRTTDESGFVDIKYLLMK